MDVFKISKGERVWVLVAGEVCSELTYFYVLRLSQERSIAAKRDGLLYAYRPLTPGEVEQVEALLERKDLSKSDVRSLVSSLLSKGAEWGRRDMPVYRFRGAVVEVSPPRNPRRLFIRTSNPALAEALQREFKARWLPRLKGWLVAASDWRSVVEKVRALAERAGREKEMV